MHLLILPLLDFGLVAEEGDEGARPPGHQDLPQGDELVVFSLNIEPTMLILPHY